MSLSADGSICLRDKSQKLLPLYDSYAALENAGA